MLMYFLLLGVKCVEPAVVYAGAEAIEQVAILAGRPLTYQERRVVLEEGFVDGLYVDSKGIITSGVGQTGAFRGLSFTATFRAHKDRAIARFPLWFSFTEDLKAELIVAEYRGDLGHSPKTVALINEERWHEASLEFLRHDEYVGTGALRGIQRRLEKLSVALSKQGMHIP